MRIVLLEIAHHFLPDCRPLYGGAHMQYAQARAREYMSDGVDSDANYRIAKPCVKPADCVREQRVFVHN